MDIDVGNDGSAELTGVDRFADSGAAGVALPAGTAINIGILAGGNKVTSFTTLSPGVGSTSSQTACSTCPRGQRLLAACRGTHRFDRLSSRTPWFTPCTHHRMQRRRYSRALVDNLAFGDISNPIQVPPGAYNLDFGYTAGSDRPMEICCVRSDSRACRW